MLNPMWFRADHTLGTCTELAVVLDLCVCVCVYVCVCVCVCFTSLHTVKSLDMLTGFT